MVQLKCEGNKFFAVESTLRHLLKNPCYLVWALLDCDRNLRADAIYAGIDNEDWSDDDAREDEISEEQKDFGNRTILTHTAHIGETKPDLEPTFVV